MYWNFGAQSRGGCPLYSWPPQTVLGVMNLWDENVTKLRPFLTNHTLFLEADLWLMYQLTRLCLLKSPWCLGAHDSWQSNLYNLYNIIYIIIQSIQTSLSSSALGKKKMYYCINSWTAIKCAENFTEFLLPVNCSQQLWTQPVTLPHTQPSHCFVFADPKICLEDTLMLRNCLAGVKQISLWRIHWRLHYPYHSNEWLDRIIPQKKERKHLYIDI